MSKIELTAYLGQKIKDLRLKHKVKSKDLAIFLEKSPAYISKLERGDIKSIERIELEKIISFISNNNLTYSDFIEFVSEDIPSEELEQRTWFLNFDTMERRIPITKGLINYIISKMSDLQVRSKDLIDYVNLNEDLAEDFLTIHNINPETLQSNIWYPYTEDEGNDKYTHFIYLNYNHGKLDSILAGDRDKSSYMFIYAIVYHLLKLEKKNANESIDREQLKKTATQILNDAKFYSLVERSKFSAMAKSRNEFDNLLSEFDKDNLELINDLLAKIRLMSDVDVKYTNEKLKNIVSNLSEDTSFSLGYMALALEGIIQLSVESKRNFLNEVRGLINKYEESQTSEKSVERY